MYSKPASDQSWVRKSGRVSDIFLGGGLFRLARKALGQGKSPSRKLALEVLFTGQAAPKYATDLAAGADLQAYLPTGPIKLAPGTSTDIPTGLYLALPPGYEAQVRPRSGLAFRYGVTVLNSPGTIDADFRGEIRVLLINHGRHEFVINHGDRIAQLVVAPVVRAVFRLVEALPPTDRGLAGLGSTGVRPL